MADRVLRHLNEDRVAGLEGGLDAAGLAFQAHGVPVHLACVQDGVAAAAHVDERSFHRGQDVLDAAQVNVANHRGLRAAGDVVLDEQAVFEDRDLIEAVLVSDDHRALDGLAARQELRLGNRVAAASFAASLAPTHLLGLQAGRALEGLDLIGGVGALLGGCGRACAAATTATARGIFLVGRLGVVRGGFHLLRAVLGGGLGLVRLLGAAATAGLRLGGALLGLGGRCALLGGGRGLVGGLLGATAALGRGFLGGSGLFLGRGGLAATLGLGLFEGDRRGHLGRGLEDGSLEQQRRGGGHGRS